MENRFFSKKEIGLEKVVIVTILPTEQSVIGVRRERADSRMQMWFNNTLNRLPDYNENHVQFYNYSVILI